MIETRRLKNVFIFFHTILRFVLSRKIIGTSFRKSDWLLSCSYNLHKADRKNHLKTLGKKLDSQSSKYDNFIVLGDFNAKRTESAMSNFMEIYDLKNLQKEQLVLKILTTLLVLVSY